MSKPKFNPVVTRIKLNPEQAVLACTCWDVRLSAATTSARTSAGVCLANASPREIACNRTTSANAAIS